MLDLSTGLLGILLTEGILLGTWTLDVDGLLTDSTLREMLGLFPEVVEEAGGQDCSILVDDIPFWLGVLCWLVSLTTPGLLWFVGAARLGLWLGLLGIMTSFEGSSYWQVWKTFLMARLICLLGVLLGPKISSADPFSESCWAPLEVFVTRLGIMALVLGIIYSWFTNTARKEIKKF